ncbi:MAG: ABC transporter substrate-binding protein [Spirochaetales bacterium]
MKRKLLSLLLILISASTLAFAQAGKPASAAKDVKLRFSWWGADSRHKATLAAIKLYETQNPGVKIEGEYGAFGNFYLKLITQLNGNTAPDIFQVDYKWVYDLLSQNKSWFVDMRTLSDKIDLSGFDMKYAMAWGSADNYLIGLPMGVNAIGLVYNKSLLEKAGVAINDSWDWNDLLDAGAKVKKLGKEYYAAFFNKSYLNYMVKVQIKQKTGNDLITKDYKLGFTKSDMVDVFAYIQKLLDTGTIPPFEEMVPFEMVYADQTPNWLNGKYGICPTSSSLIPSIRAASKFDIGVARYPIYDNAKNPGLITAPTMLLALNSRSPNLPEAIKFANWILNDKDAALVLGDARGMPASSIARTVLAQNNRLDKNIQNMVEKAIPFTGGPEGDLSQNQEVVTILDDYIQQVGYRNMSPEMAAEGLMKDLADKAAEMSKK